MSAPGEINAGSMTDSGRRARFTARGLHAESRALHIGRIRWGTPAWLVVIAALLLSIALLLQVLQIITFVLGTPSYIDWGLRQSMRWALLNVQGSPEHCELQYFVRNVYLRACLRW